MVSRCLIPVTQALSSKFSLENGPPSNIPLLHPTLFFKLWAQVVQFQIPALLLLSVGK